MSVVIVFSVSFVGDVSLLLFWISVNVLYSVLFVGLMNVRFGCFGVFFVMFFCVFSVLFIMYSVNVMFCCVMV